MYAEVMDMSKEPDYKELYLRAGETEEKTDVG